LIGFATPYYHCLTPLDLLVPPPFIPVLKKEKQAKKKTTTKKEGLKWLPSSLTYGNQGSYSINDYITGLVLRQLIFISQIEEIIENKA
jgi:hypothetical protein